jgi:hypothetical protein
MTTCNLTQSDSYIETLTLRPIAALPDSFELLIQSQLLNARDPSARRVQHRVIVTGSALGELRHVVDGCLAIQAQADKLSE